MEQEYEDATVELCTRQFCESSGISVEFLFFYFFCHFLAFRKQTFMYLVIICGNPMYTTDRQTDRQRAMLNASTYGAVE